MNFKNFFFIISFSLVLLSFNIYLFNFKIHNKIKEKEIIFKNKNKKLNGFYKNYKNCKLKSIEKYKNGIKDSIWLYFHENGNLDHKQYYVNGKRNGIENYYSYHNCLIYKEIWSKGVLKKRIILDSNYYFNVLFIFDYGKKFFKKSKYKNNFYFLKISENKKRYLLKKEGFSDYEVKSIIYYTEKLFEFEKAKSKIKYMKYFYTKKV